MSGTRLFEEFDTGEFAIPQGGKRFADLAWNNHPAFDGVALKHLLEAKDTGGMFSYHLVRIAPGRAIGDHIHDPQTETHEVVAGHGLCRNDGREIPYRPGVISLFQPRTRHEVTAGEDGLLLFAKFMPPLC